MKRIIIRLMLAVAVAVAVPMVIPADCHAQGVITPPKPKPTPKPKPKPTPTPKPTPAVTVTDARTSYRSMDLQARRDGRYYYFNPEEWSALTSAQKKLFTPEGVVMKIGDEEFVVALHDQDNGKEYNWDEAMLLYGDILPTKEQGEILVKYKNILNDRLKAYGGTIMDDYYWTNIEYDSSYAWYVYMNSGYVYFYIKTNTGRVRAVAPVPVASAR